MTKYKHLVPDMEVFLLCRQNPEKEKLCITAKSQILVELLTKRPKNFLSFMEHIQIQACCITKLWHFFRPGSTELTTDDVGSMVLEQDCYYIQTSVH